MTSVQRIESDEYVPLLLKPANENKNVSFEGEGVSVGVKPEGFRSRTSARRPLSVRDFQKKVPLERGAAISQLSKIGYAPLFALSIFKRISSETLARIVGAPEKTIDSFFNGKSNDLSNSARINIAEVLGVDLRTGKLSGKQVHNLYLDELPFFSSNDTFQRHMHSLSVLISPSRAVKVGFPTEKKVFSSMPNIYALQNETVRILFYSGKAMLYNSSFDPDHLSACKWAMKNKHGTIDVLHKEAAQRILCGDVTSIEFDEIFDGKKALCWADVEAEARQNQVTKREIITWIQTVGSNRVVGRESLPLKVVHGNSDELSMADSISLGSQIQRPSTFKF